LTVSEYVLAGNNTAPRQGAR